MQADHGPDASLKLHLIKSAHTHARTHTHTDGKDRPGFNEISSYNFIPSSGADTIKLSTWRQNKEKKTVKINNLKREGRIVNCPSEPERWREGGRDGEDTEVFCCVS